ncbi:MAG TPA: hypothetical protein PLW09_05530 [Candidatus Kapabacteria bacterium]|nr:hypothetical protein [Candidatus Kapabacteria bacterium]HRI31862.1 hypothetical protein [Candidatus Kapabacteria bacterium]HRK58963.1 hypothetical protein [Candidatus Kapabacteria bacterium]
MQLSQNLLTISSNRPKKSGMNRDYVRDLSYFRVQRNALALFIASEFLFTV